MLITIIALSNTAMTPYLNDSIIILQQTIVDPYPEVKKVSYYAQILFHCRYTVMCLLLSRSSFVFMLQ